VGLLGILGIAFELNKTKKQLKRDADKLVERLKFHTVKEIEDIFLDKPIPVGSTPLGQLVLLVSLKNKKPSPLMFHLTSFKAEGKRFIIWGGVMNA
jgi:hypothetical protein